MPWCPWHSTECPFSLFVSVPIRHGLGVDGCEPVWANITKSGCVVCVCPYVFMVLKNGGLNVRVWILVITTGSCFQMLGSWLDGAIWGHGRSFMRWDLAGRNSLSSKGIPLRAYISLFPGCLSHQNGQKLLKLSPNKYICKQVVKVSLIHVGSTFIHLLIFNFNFIALC